MHWNGWSTFGRNMVLLYDQRDLIHHDISSSGNTDAIFIKIQINENDIEI